MCLTVHAWSAKKQASKQANKQTNKLLRGAHSTDLENLTVPLLVNKSQHFMDTERSQVPATCPCSELYQSRRSPRTFSWKFILILSFLLYVCHPSGLVTLGFPTKTLNAPLLFAYTLHAPPISFFVIWKFWGRQNMKLPTVQFFPVPCHPGPLRTTPSSPSSYYQTPSACIPSSV